MIKIEGRIYTYWLQTSATGPRLNTMVNEWNIPRGIENERGELKMKTTSCALVSLVSTGLYFFLCQTEFKLKNTWKRLIDTITYRC